MKNNGSKILAPGLQDYVDRGLISHAALEKCLRRYIERRDRICSYKSRNKLVSATIKEEYYVPPPE